jgi:hypothetical protein
MSLRSIVLGAALALAAAGAVAEVTTDLPAAVGGDVWSTSSGPPTAGKHGTAGQITPQTVDRLTRTREP